MNFDLCKITSDDAFNFHPDGSDVSESVDVLSDMDMVLDVLDGQDDISDEHDYILNGKDIPEETPEIQIGLEHDYHYQVVSPTHRMVRKSPPPLIGISSKTEESKESETSRHEPNLILTPQQSPIHTPNISVVENNSRKRKLPVPRKPSNLPKRRVTVNLQNMHSETIDILREINSNIKRNSLCGIHGKILDILQGR
ncbi:hypothetical protein JTB14_035666 [Gonioctena quinquepunctata]|nr:hypothetical protein JTB14_035666 [Gonioctena quinquepunctata]